MSKNFEKEFDDLKINNFGEEGKKISIRNLGKL